MAKGKTLCNMCGKELDEFDLQEKFGHHDTIGYGSKHDEEVCDLDLCGECWDRVMDDLIPRMKINPFTDRG